MGKLLDRLEVKAYSLKTRIGRLASWDESQVARGKTTPGSRGGSFAPKGGSSGLMESGSLMDRFREAYRETGKTRTRLVRLEDRIDNFKNQGKEIPAELKNSHRKALADNKKWFAREEKLRERLRKITYYPLPER